MSERDEEEASLRVPPHSVEAEQSVIGALLLDNSASDRMGITLRDRHFYRHEHRAIFAVISELIGQARPADVITVHEQLQRRAPDDDFGGMAYLNALAQSVPGTANVRRYAEIVRDHAARREVMRIASLQREAAQAAKLPISALIDQGVTALLALMQGTQDREPVALRESVQAFVDEMQARLDGKTDAISTGLADLDRLTSGGGRPGELWVIGALPSMGKSALILQLARHVGTAHNVLLLTMEDSLMVAAMRHVAAAGRVNLAHLRNPQHAPERIWPDVAAAVDELAGLSVWMDDQPALGAADVRRKVQQVTARHGAPRLLIIDYLQMMDGDAGETRNRELGRLSYQMQALAKQAGVWVVLLSQLNREAVKRSGPPEMADLRDSGDIEGAARVIAMLHRQFVRKPTAENKHWAQLHVCKQSNGPTATLDLHFDGALQRFGNWDGPRPYSTAGSD